MDGGRASEDISVYKKENKDLSEPRNWKNSLPRN